MCFAIASITSTIQNIIIINYITQFLSIFQYGIRLKWSSPLSLQIRTSFLTPAATLAAMATDSYTSINNPYEPSKPLAYITLGSVTKLLPTNYLNWQLQVEAFLDGYDLLKYPDGSLPAPSKTITTKAETPVTTENHAYQTWRRQDRLIYGTLLTIL